MMKKLLLISTLLLLLAGGLGFFLLKKKVLHAPDFKPDAARRESPLDLRPEAIAKLRQMVHDGSDGLYQLQIDSLDADIARGALTLSGVSLVADSGGYERLLAAKKLPDDVYHIHFRRLTVSGLGLADLLNNRNIRIDGVRATQPDITVYHQRRDFNRDKRVRDRNKSFYARLQPFLESLVVDSISIERGAFADVCAGSPARTQKFREVSVQVGGLQIDAQSGEDSSRFLFARHFALQTAAFSIPLADNQYELGIEGAELTAAGGSLLLRQLTLRPKGGRAAFLAKQSTQTEIFEILLPSLQLKGIDWWAALHAESFRAASAEIRGGRVDIYLDRTLPVGNGTKKDNFPQQMLLDAGLPVSIRQITVEDSRLSYEERNQEVSENGIITFDRLQARAANVTNLPAEIRTQREATFNGSCLFMNRAPMKGDFSFSLPRASRGAFRTTIECGRMDAATVSRFAEPMGLIRFTDGEMEKGRAQLKGNNDRITGEVSAVYHDLKLMPLKSADDGNTKRRPFMAFIANSVLVKNANPGANGKLRTATIDYRRSDEGNYFNFAWLALKSGLLRLIGVPQKVGM